MAGLTLNGAREWPALEAPDVGSERYPERESVRPILLGNEGNRRYTRKGMKIFFFLFPSILSTHFLKMFLILGPWLREAKLEGSGCTCGNV